MRDQEEENKVDNSRKSILARGCDPLLSLQFSKVAPQLLGNVEYVPTTNDIEFVEQLKSRDWSVIYFAPGACRFSAVNKQIPGGNTETAGWTLVEYRELIVNLQRDNIQIVETPYESEALEFLKRGLDKARETKLA